MVQFNFDSANHTPAYGGSSGNNLPVGKHKVVIFDDKVLPTKDGSGNSRLVFTLKSIEGAASGQLHDDGLNIYHTNPLTVKIAGDQLAAYATVMGKPRFQDTRELHNIPFFVDIQQQKNNPRFTEVVAVYDINGNEPRKSSVPVQGGPPAGFAPTSASPGAGGQTLQPQQAWGAQPTASEPAPWAQPAQPAQPQQGWAPGPAGAAPGWGQR